MALKSKISRRRVLEGATALGLAAAAPKALSIGGVRAATPKKGGRLRIGMADYATQDTLNPELNETRMQMNLNWQLRNCLVEVGPGGSYVPELAESWEASDKADVWVFKIRKGVEFHNGKSLTADDVVHSLNLHRREDTVSSAKPFLANVTEITASDKHEVTIRLSDGNVEMPAIMTLFPLLIVPEGEGDHEKGLGTGGYSLVEFEPGVRSLVKRNPNYWKEGRAHFDEVEILAIKDANARSTALITGEVDTMNFVDIKTVHLLEGASGISTLPVKGKLHWLFSMRMDTPPYDDNDFRQALKYAIDREEIVDKMLKGYGSVGNNHSISAAYPNYAEDLPQISYDPDKARHHLKKAGHDSISIQLHVSKTPFDQAIDTAVLYKEHAKKAGIDIEVVREPEDGYWTNVWGEVPFFASRWSGRVTEDVMFSTAFSAEALATGWNATRFDHDRFNEILRLARVEFDDDKRKALYVEAQQILKEEGGDVIPAFADFVDGVSDKIAHDGVSSDWELDGARCGERWWFS